MHQIVAADVPQADRLTIRILAAVAEYEHRVFWQF
jgi:hypothetical protein